MTSLQVSPQQAAAELLRRRRARESLAGFANAIDVPGRPLKEEDAELDWLFQPVETTLAAHHLLLLRNLDDLVNPAHPLRNMMVFMPPGSAKSTYGSVVCPAYAMGKYPGLKVIMASYASDIARKQSRKVRAIVRQPKFSGLWAGGKIVQGNESVEHWSLENGSEYMAGGILAGMTGNRAGLLVIDDPVKGREDADSETIRKKTSEAYEDDLKTRLIPGASTLIIQTRWHEDDLSGRILPENWSGQSGMVKCRDGQEWLVLCLPAVASQSDDPLGRKIGEPLWPEWFTGDHFAKFKANKRTWTALFQQVPTPDDGDYFKKDSFRYYGTKPAHLRIYAASDYAVTEGDGDWTEHGIFGVDSEERAYLLDWWRGQTTPEVWIDTMLDMAHKWKPVLWWGESGVIRRSVEPFLMKRMRERKIFQPVAWLPSISDKPTRARSIQGRYGLGMVYHPSAANAPWIADLERQMLAFPAGRNDDGVDVLGLFGRGIESTFGAEEPGTKALTPEQIRRKALNLPAEEASSGRSKYRD